jgi:hypothetical protein
MYLHAHPHRVENHLAILRHFCLPLMCAALQGHLCLRRSRLCCTRFLLRRDLPGVMVSATNMLIVKSSQHQVSMQQSDIGDPKHTGVWGPMTSIGVIWMMAVNLVAKS